MIRKITLALVILAVTTTAGLCRPRHHHHTVRAQHVIEQPVYSSDTADTDQRYPSSNRYNKPEIKETQSRTVVSYDRGDVLGSRPSGCPHAFCGCEASRYVFGKIDPYLNLAANWIRRFPRTSPAPGMAAARSGHVFILISHASGNEWLVHDGNSGHHLTREHVRSIAGYVIVDPHGTRYASR